MAAMMSFIIALMLNRPPVKICYVIYRLFRFFLRAAACAFFSARLRAAVKTYPLRAFLFFATDNQTAFLDLSGGDNLYHNKRGGDP